MIGMKITGASELDADLVKLRERVAVEVVEAAAQAAVAAMKIARELTPVESGRSRDGWFVRVIGGFSGKSRGMPLVVLDHEFNHRGKFPRTGPLGYSLLDILEFGSRAHEITPTSSRSTRLGRGLKAARNQGARFLRFVAGGDLVFTRRVSHPGTKAYGMLRRTTPIAQRMFNTLAQNALNKLAQEFMRGR